MSSSNPQGDDDGTPNSASNGAAPEGSNTEAPTATSKVPRRSFLKYAIAGGVVAAVAIGGGTYYYVNYLAPNSSNSKPDTVVIAWNAQIQSLDPNSAVHANAPLESPIYAMFDQYVTQDRNLNYQPGVISSWNWGSDNQSINMTVRSDVKFHDGTQLSADDIAYSIQVASQKGQHFAAIWSNVASSDINSSTSLTLHLKKYDPAFPVWFCFLNSFIIPKAYYSRVGQSGFATSPVGSGPYKFVSYQGGVLRLTAFPDYWGGAPAIQNVVFKEVTDPSARLSELQSGTSDFTLQINPADFNSIASSSTGNIVTQKVYTTDIATFFVSPYFEPFKDQNVRLAVHYALDKQSLVNNVLLGLGRPVSMCEAQGYKSYDPNFNFPYDPNKAKSLLQAAGYSSSNPLNLTVMTTNGYSVADYQLAQACVQMWQNVGINVKLDTITVAQFFSNRSAGTLDALSLYVWSNATGDPENDIGDEMSPHSPFAAWAGVVNAGKTDYTGLMSQADQMTAPLFSESDSTTRYKQGTTASEWAVNNGLIIPIYQQAQPLVMKRNLQYNPWPQGWILAQSMSWT